MGVILSRTLLRYSFRPRADLQRTRLVSDRMQYLSEVSKLVLTTCQILKQSNRQPFKFTVQVKRLSEFR